MAGAFPNNRVFGLRMPVPHAAARLVSNSQLPVSQGWVQLICSELGSLGGQSGLSRGQGDLLRKDRPADQQQDRGNDDRYNSHKAPRDRHWRLYGKNAKTRR